MSSSMANALLCKVKRSGGLSTPGAEAPAELVIHHPGLRVLNMTEIASQNFHNLLPLRGAQARDALAWSRYLDGALQRYGAGSDVLIAQHNWPV